MQRIFKKLINKWVSIRQVVGALNQMSTFHTGVPEPDSQLQLLTQQSFKPTQTLENTVAMIVVFLSLIWKTWNELLASAQLSLKHCRLWGAHHWIDLSIYHFAF